MSGLIAWATVPGNNLGADPGITVTTYSGDGGVTQEYDLPASELDRDFLLDAYSEFNARHADELLARAGYERTGEWQESGGQWGADVDLTPSKGTGHPALRGRPPG
jgi:hypothetical protein